MRTLFKCVSEILSILPFGPPFTHINECGLNRYRINNEWLVLSVGPIYVSAMWPRCSIYGCIFQYIYCLYTIQKHIWRLWYPPTQTQYSHISMHKIYPFIAVSIFQLDAMAYLLIDFHCFFSYMRRQIKRHSHYIYFPTQFSVYFILSMNAWCVCVCVSVCVLAEMYIAFTVARISFCWNGKIFIYPLDWCR